MAHPLFFLFNLEAQLSDALIPNHFGFDERDTRLIIIIMDPSSLLESRQDVQGYEILRPAG